MRTLEVDKTPLSSEAEKLLEAIRGSKAEWLTRAMIAQHLGKRRLNPMEIALLEMLNGLGMIEIAIRDDPRPVGYRYEYRVKDS